MTLGGLIGFVAILFLLSGAPPASADAPGPAKLKVVVSGLPTGVPARAVVRGPGIRRNIRRSATFRRARRGRYSISVRSVRIKRSRRGVKAGSVALPVRRTFRVRVRAGRTTTARVRYGTIKNANVRSGLHILAFSGPAVSPETVAVRRSARVRKGQILTKAPSASLPAGLFHRVVGVRRVGGRLILTLRPARISEAFPQLDVSSRLRLKAGGASAAKARAAGFSSIVAGLGIGNFKCRTPLVGSALSASQTLSPDVSVDLHLPLFPPGKPSGRMTLSLAGSQKLDALLRSRLGCSASLPLPPLQGVIPPGIPVYGQVGVTGGLEAASDVEIHESASLSLTGGFSFRGADIDPIASARASGNLSMRGTGKVSVGPDVRLAVGAAAGADVHLDLQPRVAISGGSGACSVDLSGGAQAGVKVGVGKFKAEANKKFDGPKVNVHRCPPGGSNGGANPGSAPTERARIDWDTDGSDVDLHVWDEAGNHAWYGAQSGVPRANLSSDITSGFGPEWFTDLDAPSTRRLTYGLCYYEDNGVGPTTVALKLVDPNGAVRRSTHSLSATGDHFLVGASPAGGGYTPPDDWCG